VILGQYENHEEIDYKRTKFFIKDGDSVLGITLDRIFEGARLKMGYFFGFSHYLITGLLMAMWLWLAIPKNY
jgi:hypothetical protein